jgi:ribosomal protein S6
MAKKVAEVTPEEQTTVRKGVYEVGYHIVPTIAEENLGEEVTALKDLLGDNGANFISEEYPRLMELAYEMTRSIANKKQKFATGYFGWVKFECTPEEAKTIKELLDKNEKLVRYLLIKTVRENTISPKRAYVKQENKRRTPFRVKDTPEVEEPTESIKAVDEDEIDKEIEALAL